MGKKILSSLIRGKSLKFPHYVSCAANTGPPDAEQMRLMALDGNLMYQHKLQQDRGRANDACSRPSFHVQRMPLGKIAWDTEFRIVAWDPAAEGIFGWTAAEAIGKHAYELIVPPALQPHVEAAWNKLLEGDESSYAMNGNTRKGGEWLACEWHNTPLRNADGEITGVLSMVNDVTRRTQAEELEQIKDEMISAVSHEMRTPLTAMLGYTEYMLENETEQDRQNEFIRIIHNETERLSDLIGNFLDLQRFRSSQDFLECSDFSLHSLIEETVILFAGMSQKHRLVMECPPGLPKVSGDAGLLHQMLNNLVSNAVKYSPEGGEIHVGGRRDDDGICLSVTDEGVGLAPHLLEKVFDKFYRVSSSDRKTAGGTGLGLALVREIVKAHGGRVWAESTPGRGSTFHVFLPVTKRLSDHRAEKASRS